MKVIANTGGGSSPVAREERLANVSGQASI